MTILLVAGLFAGHLFATEPCQQIRDVRALAVKQGLDDATLRTLETQHCVDKTTPHPVIPPVGHCHVSEGKWTSDCATLTTMTRLARLGGKPEIVTRVETQRAITCSIGSAPATFSWPNGTTAKYSNGTWQWPNATTALYSNGTWQYPTATTAKYSNGTWQYPNATTAKYSNGKWQKPNASSATADELITWACEKVGPDDCAMHVDAIRRSQGDERDLAILELAWEAR